MNDFKLFENIIIIIVVVIGFGVMLIILCYVIAAISNFFRGGV